MRKSIKLASVLLAISPCLTPYILFSGTDLGLFVLIIATLIVIGETNCFPIFRSLEVKFFIAVLALSVITLIGNIGSSWFSTKTFFNNFWAIGICFSALIIVSPRVDVSSFKQTVLTVSILASLIVIYQRFQILVTGTFNREFYLPFFQLAEDVAHVTRPSAFYKEPSHLAQYIMPAFYLALLENKYFLSILFCIAILSSGSTTGFLLLPIVFFIWFTTNSKSKNHKILIIIIIGATYLIFREFLGTLIDSNMEKVNDTEEGESNIRLLGGLAFFSYFSLSEKIAGIGFNQLSNFFGARGDVSNYSNGFIFMAISYGYIGLSALLIYLVNVYLQYRPYLGFYLILIAVFCTSQVLFSITLLYLLTFCILGQKINNYK